MVAYRITTCSYTELLQVVTITSSSWLTGIFSRSYFTSKWVSKRPPKGAHFVQDLYRKDWRKNNSLKTLNAYVQFINNYELLIFTAHDKHWKKKHSRLLSIDARDDSHDNNSSHGNQLREVSWVQSRHPTLWRTAVFAAVFPRPETPAAWVSSYMWTQLAAGRAHCRHGVRRNLGTNSANTVRVPHITCLSHCIIGKGKCRFV